MTVNRTHLLLTPAVTVIAITGAAVIAANAPRTLDYVRSWGDDPKPAASPQPSYTVEGAIRLQHGQYKTAGGACAGDVESGDQVIVTNASGAALTYAEIRAGRVTDSVCEMPFTLVIPAGGGEYGVDVPTWGLTKYSEKELADTLTLTFG